LPPLIHPVQGDDMSEADRDLTAFDRVRWPARTRRLVMRPVTVEDFPRLYQIRATPGVSH
jgi:hypothetical protein